MSIQKCRLQIVSHFGQTSWWYNRRIESMKPLRLIRKLALLEATLITLRYTCTDCLVCGIWLHIEESRRKIPLAPGSMAALCILLNSSLHSLRRGLHRKWNSKVFSKLSFINNKRMSVKNHRKTPDWLWMNVGETCIWRQLGVLPFKMMKRWFYNKHLKDLIVQKK